MGTSKIIEHLEKLRYFVVIAEEKSFARAAKKLRLSQPTLSHSIRILEEALAVQLFHRSSTGVSLTRMGEQLYQFGTKVLTEAQQLEHVLHLSEEEEMGTLTVGTKEPFAIGLWPRYIEFLGTAFPKLDVILKIVRSNPELIALLQAETVDLVMIPDPPQTQGVVAYELFKESYHFYLSKEKFQKASSEKIHSLPIYLFQNSLCGGNTTIGKVLKQRGQGDGQGQRRIRDVDSYSVTRSLVLKGLGIGLLPDSLVLDDVAAGTLRQISIPSLDPSWFGSVSICLCLLEKYSRNPHLVAVKKALRGMHKS